VSGLFWRGVDDGTTRGEPARMAKSQTQGDLFPSKDGGAVVFLNGRCQIRREGDERMVLVAGMPIAHYREGDRMAAANAMVMLVECGWAQQMEAARAFSCDVRTVRRAQQRFEDGGLAALGRTAGYPRGRRRDHGRDGRVAQLKAEGCSNREIARRLGCSEKAVRKRLRRLGFEPARAVQAELPLPAPVTQGADPNVSGPAAATVDEAALGFGGADPNVSGPAAATTTVTTTVAVTPNEELPFTLDNDPADRRWDRLFAYLGLIDDAAPLFRDGSAVPRAAVLLAIPALLSTGVLDAAKQTWGSIGPAFYGLRTTIVTMLLMALLRIKRPEALKEHAPPDLGRVLGLDRAPEVKTLRRKLTRLTAMGGAELFGRLLAHRRVATHGHAMGFLYIDGHVRIYYGQRRIPKTHAARIHAIAPATSDYWVNDQAGDPLFVVTAQANASVTKMLPGLLDQIRKLVGDRRVTVVFDRGGYSPKLFVKILAAGFDILTYRKGRWRRVPRRQFHRQRATLDGRRVDYMLADQEIRLLGGKLRLRQVTRLQDDHQTPVLTSRRDLAAVEVAFRMFERWRQENFSKYLREEYLLDALVDYAVEPDDPTRDVPNPKRAEVDDRIKRVRAEITELQRQVFAANAMDAAGVGHKIDKDALAPRIWQQYQRAIKLSDRRKRIPTRVPVAQTTDQDIVKLATQKKHLTNVIKLVAYQAESELVRMITPHYHRADDEGRTLVQSALASAADIKVTDTELLVTLAPLSSPHRSRAVAALCQHLNATATTFPGSRLRLRYAVAGLPEPPEPDISRAG
jgi:prepilin-type processing-associated H-X9-DG protein